MKFVTAFVALILIGPSAFAQKSEDDGFPKLNSVAVAGNMLKTASAETEIQEAADYIVDRANATQRAKYAKALAAALKPHFRSTDPKTRAKVARAFAFVASRDDTPALLALCDFELESDPKCVGYGFAGLIRVDGLKGRTMFEERFDNLAWRNVVRRTFLDANQETWAYPLLESSEYRVFHAGCEFLRDHGTKRSVDHVRRAMTGLWSPGEQGRVDSLGRSTIAIIQKR